MVAIVSFKVNAAGPVNLLGTVLPAMTAQAIKKGAGAAAVQVQNMMRDELDRLIYNTPISPSGYIRTGTLRRATYAARPGANHSADHDAAKSGVDLEIKPPAAGGVVRLKGFEAEIEVGSWADYAFHVHEGHGPGNRVPKPFTVRPAMEANKILTEEINRAIAAMLAATVK